VGTEAAAAPEGRAAARAGWEEATAVVARKVRGKEATRVGAAAEAEQEGRTAARAATKAGEADLEALKAAGEREVPQADAGLGRAGETTAVVDE